MIVELKKLIFYVALAFILTYLILDVLINTEGKEARPIVQIIGGLALIFSTLYNILLPNLSYSLFRNWSSMMIWLCFLTVMIIYYMLSFFNIPTALAISDHRNIVIAILLLSLVVFFYNATLTGTLTGVVLSILVIFIIINGIMSIYIAYINMPNIQNNIMKTSAGYGFLLVLPLLLYIFQKNKMWVFVITLLLTLIFAKRGAIAIYIVLIIYSILSIKVFQTKIILRGQTLILLFIGVVTLLFLVNNVFDSLLFRLTNIRNSGGYYGSGRTFFWFNMLDQWWNANLGIKVIGFGTLSTKTFDGHIAHNDFIQYLLDYGFIGLGLWMSFLFTLYKNIKRRKYIDAYVSKLLMFCLFIFIGRGLFAGTVRPDNMFLSICIGFLIGTIEKKHNQQKMAVLGDNNN